MKTLVGGAAAAMFYSEYRRIKDMDFLTNEDIPKEIDGVRVEKFYHPDLENWDWQPVANPDELYTLKVSHMFWNNNWVKHAKDVIWFQENTDAVFLPELYDILYPIWVEHYGKKRASLRKGTKAEDFFTSNVPRKYEHDSIHASVAYYDRPLFNAILQDGEDVAVSWSKFESLSQVDKLRLVWEEVYATALERHVIPSDYTFGDLAAYRKALQSTITSFWKGKWALFAVLNLSELQKPEVDYVQVHKDNSERLVLL